MFLNKVVIMDDEELLQERKNEHISLNCAEERWECFAVVSEYDYIFVCFSQGPRFGATRQIVNNCWEDFELTLAPFSYFLEKFADFTTVFRNAKENAVGNKEESLNLCAEFLNYILHRNNSNWKHPLPSML